MRLLSVRLSHFKGIESRHVEFRPTGITLIQGPNEIGKTSLMSAFDILLEYADSSQHREVEATKSSGQDRSTEIEAQFEIRGEHFTYFKRYHRDRETRLVIETGGQRRTVTGREAHDYVRAILTNTTDWELWKALKMAQGSATDQVTQVALGTSTSLREALDRAAGGGDGPADDTLFHRVKQERNAYYSANGQELKAVFGGLRERLAAIQQDIDRVDQRITLVARDTERIDVLDREIERLSVDLREAQTQLRIAEDAIGGIQAIESEHRDALQTLRQVQDRLGEVTRQWSERSRDAEHEAELTQALTALDEKIQEARNEDAEAQYTLGMARANYERVQSEREEARRTLSRLDEDANVFLTRSEWSALEKQLDRVRRLTQDQLTREAQRSRIRVTEEGLKAIRKQVDKVHQAQSGLEVGSPTACVRALEALSITVNGAATPLLQKQEKQFSISEPMVIGVPDLMDITITPGASVPDLQAKLDREQGALQKLLEQYGVGTASDAQTEWDLWRDLTRQMGEGQQQLREELPASDLSTLEERQDLLRTRVDEYQRRRPEHYPYPETVDVARQRVQDAQDILDVAEGALRQSIQDFEVAKARASHAQKVLQTLGAERLNKQGLLTEIGDRLAHMRGEVLDQEVKRQMDEAAGEGKRLKALVDRLALQLEERQPQQVRARASQLGIQVTNVTMRLNQIRQERAETQGRLATMGAEGLYEEREEAIASRNKLQSDLAALERRAIAAKTLYETVSACRDREQRRYREPLRKRITELGKVVFGSDFDVALNEDLTVISRTLHGITLGVEALSTGAKEQLALLVRLAAASLVDPAEGVPVILDDALGHTDDERLDLMAAIFTVVAKDCQIILLTSATRRYTKMGQTHVVDLWHGTTSGVDGIEGDL